MSGREGRREFTEPTVVRAGGHGRGACREFPVNVRAHRTEARRVVALSCKRGHITPVIGANRSELGLNGSKAPEQMLTIGAQSCISGGLFAVDIDDRYAFDIDKTWEGTMVSMGARLIALFTGVQDVVLGSRRRW
jgi:hypothetical protein